MGTGIIKARRLVYATLLATAAAGLVQCGGGSTSPTTSTAASLQSVSLNPTSIAGGNTVQGTVTLTAGAPAGGATVTLASSNTSVATVPSSVVVAQGSPSATFTVTAVGIGVDSLGDDLGDLSERHAERAVVGHCPRRPRGLRRHAGFRNDRLRRTVLRISGVGDGHAEAAVHVRRNRIDPEQRHHRVSMDAARVLRRRSSA